MNKKSNVLKDRYKYHRKRQKGLSPFVKLDAGDVELNNAAFNQAANGNAQAAMGMGEGYVHMPTLVDFDTLYSDGWISVVGQGENKYELEDFIRTVAGRFNVEIADKFYYFTGEELRIAFKLTNFDYPDYFVFVAFHPESGDIKDIRELKHYLRGSTIKDFVDGFRASEGRRKKMVEGFQLNEEWADDTQSKFNFLKNHKIHEGKFSRDVKVWDLNLTPEQEDYFYGYLESGFLGDFFDLGDFWDENKELTKDIFQEGRQGGHLVLYKDYGEQPLEYDPFNFRAADDIDEAFELWCSNVYGLYSYEYAYTDEEMAELKQEFTNWFNNTYDIVVDFDSRCEKLIEKLKEKIDEFIGTSKRKSISESKSTNTKKRHLLKEAWSEEYFDVMTVDEALEGFVDNMSDDEIDDVLAIYRRVAKLLSVKMGDMYVSYPMPSYNPMDELESSEYTRLTVPNEPSLSIYSITEGSENQVSFVCEHYKDIYYFYFASESDVAKFIEFMDRRLNENYSRVNIRESLNKIDLNTNNKYDLLNLYEAYQREIDKKALAKAIYERKDPSYIAKIVTPKIYLEDYFDEPQIDEYEENRDDEYLHDMFDFLKNHPSESGLYVQDITSKLTEAQKEELINAKNFGALEDFTYDAFSGMASVLIKNKKVFLTFDNEETTPSAYTPYSNLDEFIDSYDAFFGDYEDENEAYRVATNKIEEDYEELKNFDRWAPRFLGKLKDYLTLEKGGTLSKGSSKAVKENVKRPVFKRKSTVKEGVESGHFEFKRYNNLPDRVVSTDNGAYDLEQKGLSGYYVWIGYKHNAKGSTEPKMKKIVEDTARDVAHRMEAEFGGKVVVEDKWNTTDMYRVYSIDN